MKNIILILFVSLICSCSSLKVVQHIDDSCIEYYIFLKENIVTTEEGCYEFASPETIYKKYDEGKFAYPFLGECLKGKDKAFFIEYFGSPHREIIVPHDEYNVLIYCFDEICMQEKKCYQGLSSMGFIVYFNKDNTWKDIISTVGYLDGYRRMDRK